MAQLLSQLAFDCPTSGAKITITDACSEQLGGYTVESTARPQAITKRNKVGVRNPANVPVSSCFSSLCPSLKGEFLIKLFELAEYKGIQRNFITHA